MSRGISRFDIADAEITDAVELRSSGSSIIMSGVTVVSTTSATRRVVLSGVYLVNDPESRLEPEDLVTLSGTSGADGNYVVEEVVDDVTFVVVGSILSSTGGTLVAKYPAGASRVGVNSSGFTYSTKDNAQGVLGDLDTAIVNIGLVEHKALRHLIHFMSENGPGDGFGSGPYYSETAYSGVFPTSETWYETSGKVKKIASYAVTYNANKTIATETWTVFKTDGTNKAAEAVDTISYSGINETSRSRAVTVYP
jgi:hypothetical protein